MRQGAERLQSRKLPDGRRLHLHDGPIDLIIEARGSETAIAAAHHAAMHCAGGLLDALCAELPLLRAPAPGAAPVGMVAARMAQAVAPFAGECFITPMAAVAGAVAEAVLRAMCAAAKLSRASVNNGGDIAIFLGPGTDLRIGMVTRPEAMGAALFGHVVLRPGDGIGGIATSGFGGRSHSLGIADAVTVLAADAPGADASATLIANAVDLPGHAAIARAPANGIDPESDLADRLITRAVGPLADAEIAQALARGVARAQDFLARGLIGACALHLRGQTELVGGLVLPRQSAYDDARWERMDA